MVNVPSAGTTPKKPVFGAPERVYIFDKKSRFDLMHYCDYWFNLQVFKQNLKF